MRCHGRKLGFTWRNPGRKGALPLGQKIRSNQQTYENHSKPIQNNSSTKNGHTQNPFTRTGVGRTGVQSIGHPRGQSRFLLN